jgi:hypothetical protein
VVQLSVHTVFCLLLALAWPPRSPMALLWVRERVLRGRTLPGPAR